MNGGSLGVLLVWSRLIGWFEGVEAEAVGKANDTSNIVSESEDSGVNSEEDGSEPSLSFLAVTNKISRVRSEDDFSLLRLLFVFSMLAFAIIVSY